MSYICKCEICQCPIQIEDDYNDSDERICEECRVDIENGKFEDTP